MTNWKEIDTYVRKWIREAGQNIRNSFSSSLSIQTKSNPNDLVTNMDKETEQYFIKNIRHHFPDHHIMGEEGFGDELTVLDGTVWIIDPIDGTMNFIHQQRNFAISIGIYEQGEGKLGYIYDVVHDELYFAERGKGAYMDDIPLPKLTERKLNESILALNATWLIRNKYFKMEPLIQLAKDVRGNRSYGSAALEMAYVASGRLDGYLTMRLAPWDYAGGKIIIEEVGGVVTDLAGKPLDLLGVTSVFCGPPQLHQTILTQYLSETKDKN
ncbi:MAG TPA: inositol monophosphatase family protein [Chondromyces sp.]|nr:inositol monophosphatase family protein [Chondromyces sp.]